MASAVDLHLHSNISDGRHSPEEIVRKAAAAGLKVISLSDHDNVNGIPPALEEAEKFPQLRLIPGVEISTEVSDGEVHMLGYFIDYHHPELLKALETMRESRKIRAEKMISKLDRLGYPLDWQRILELGNGGTTGRPHIALALLERGYVSSFQEAFTRFLAWGGPAYVERDKMRPEEAIALIVKAGGFPVIAHPLTCRNLESLVIKLKDAGLAGLETWYKDYSEENIKWLLNLTEKHGLLATGGTDYHGLDDKTEVAIGGTDVPLEAAGRLIALDEQRMLKSSGQKTTTE